MNVTWVWSKAWKALIGKPKHSGTTVSLPFCQPKVPCRLALDRTWAFVIWSWRLTAWVMARPHFGERLRKTTKTLLRIIGISSSFDPRMSQIEVRSNTTQAAWSGTAYGSVDGYRIEDVDIFFRIFVPLIPTHYFLWSYALCCWN
jgi:hypothetical protein